MNWEKGYSATYYMTLVDPVSWRDVETVQITSGSINRESTGLRHSADVTCFNQTLRNEQWIRIYLDAKQGGSNAHEALFTGLAISPDRDIKGNWEEHSVQCYSVLKPADDILLPRGWYAPTEIEASVIIKQLLEPVPAPVVFSGVAPELDSVIIAEDNETNLSMIEAILSAINWNMRITGDGRIVISEYSNDSQVIFDPFEFDIVESELKVTSDWYDCPNVFMAVADGVTAIAKDEDADSQLSVQNRGREIWRAENGVNLAQNETLTEYAMRRLKEEQRYSVTVSYDRRYVPNVFPGDIITMHYPAQDLVGDYIVESQTIELGHGAKTSEEVIGVGL